MDDNIPVNRTAPDRPAPPISNLRARDMVRDPLRFFLTLTHTFGDIVQYRALPEPAYLINHPDYARHVLQTNGRGYNKDTYFNKNQLEALVGQGLLTSENPLWRIQRRLIQPAFHRRRLAGLAEMMITATQTLLERWDGLPGPAPEIDVAAEMMQLTLDIVTRALFGYDITHQAHVVGAALDGMIAARKPSSRGVVDNVRLLDEIVYGIIAARRESGILDQGDLLSMLLLARYEDGSPMPDRQVRDEVMSLLIAGHETTANTLSWLWYLLAQHPAVVAQMEAEIGTVLGSTPPTFENVSRLPFTYRVIQESMRLYPSAWSLSRRALHDDVIGGFAIPQGAVIAISPYTLHRHPDFWPDPERFDPDRFLPEAAAGRHPFAYIPFGGGARICIGNEFAMLESALIVPAVLQRYRMQLVADHPVETHVLATLRPRHGIRVTLQRR